jgi:hypothetical protein
MSTCAMPIDLFGALEDASNDRWLDLETGRGEFPMPSQQYARALADGPKPPAFEAPQDAPASIF